VNEFSEYPLLFRCEGLTLSGILHRSSISQHRLGVLIVVGGPQYRVGSHRQFVYLARSLAKAGFSVLRFDLRGMGDSFGDPITFEEAGPDLNAAIGALLDAEPGLDGVVLWGLCDAASAILMFAAQDSRVHGAVLLNPWVRSDATLASARISGYYLKRLLSSVFWRRVVSGKVDLKASIYGFLNDWRKKLAWQNYNMSSALSANERTTPLTDFRGAMLRGLERFDEPILLILSEEDLTAGEFVELTASEQRWSKAIARTNVTVRRLEGADHTFSSAEWRAAVETWTKTWLEQIVSAQSGANENLRETASV